MSTSSLVHFITAGICVLCGAVLAGVSVTAPDIVTRLLVFVCGGGLGVFGAVIANRAARAQVERPRLSLD